MHSKAKENLFKNKIWKWFSTKISYNYFWKKLSIKFEDIKFKEDKIKDINNLVEIAMINKFKELINKELNN